MRHGQLTGIVLAIWVGPGVAQTVERADTRANVEAMVRERLAKFDANGDGTVTRAEILAFAKARATERADKTFVVMDKDGNGQITRAEYDAYITSKIDAPAAQRADEPPVKIADAVKAALARFDAADLDRNGTLSAAERAGARVER